jgi:hypothetical protein
LTKEDPVEYDLQETIDELRGWLNRGERFYPIDTAISALHWLEKAPGGTAQTGSFPLSFEDTKAELRAWLANEDQYLPEPIGEAALYWLKRPHPANPFVGPERTQ